LQSVVKHALLQAVGPVIVPAYLPDLFRRSHSKSDICLREIESEKIDSIDFSNLTRQRLAAGSDDIHRELVGIAEQKIFAEVLEHTNGNLTQAAKRLGITRTTLRTRLEALGMTLERSAKLEMD
jgi:two-component system nitrogen regulation response regulator GlnG